MKLKLKFVFFVGFVLLAACSKNTVQDSQSNVKQNIEFIATPAEVRDVPPSIDRSKYVAVQDEGPSSSNPATAHAVYLKDPMQFLAVPDFNKLKGHTAVIGSRVALFYPDAKIKTEADLAGLPAGIPIPLGTVIAIGEKVQNSDKENYQGTQMFKFQDNFNWFYPTEYQGKKGLVFGADLYGYDSDLAHNRITSLLYKNLGGYANFYPINGYEYLADPISKGLLKDRLSTQIVDPREYYIGIDTPDDMISLYEAEVEGDDNKYKPIFVSTDLFAHSMHRFFDYLLQDIEETSFTPRLSLLITSYRDVIKKELGQNSKNTSYTDALKLADNYFAVAEALLALAPIKEEKLDESNHKAYEYRDINTANVLAQYNTDVQAELKFIMAAQGFETSPLFGYKEDYSQFKPRGHYTKNGILASYFKAMMWFGRVNITIAVAADADPDAKLNARKVAPVALTIAELSKQNKALYRQWQALFDPITDLIGMSDDISLADLIPFKDAQNFKVPDDFVESKLDVFTQNAMEKLRAPLISDHSFFDSVAGNNASKTPLNWRLFGQRFTFDSWIQNQVSAPRMMKRDYVKGLDITKVFGSKTADTLLASEYQTIPELKTTLDDIANKLQGLGTEFWKASYYNATLDMVRTQARFEPGTGFYFTESPAWGIKSQISALGTWAELRHDTLLYAKQSYAERAGDGDFAATFRTIELPKPVNYIEPNLQFFKAQANAIKLVQDTLASYQLLNDKSLARLKNFAEITDRVSLIVAQEIADKPIASEDNLWIRKIAAELAPLLLPLDGPEYSGEMSDEDREKSKMAVIADVFTNVQFSKVLEVGVGKPERIYVPLNDGQGGKRIAIGYVLSYYEFLQDMGNRMTDEEWRAQVYDPSKNVEDKKPDWAKGRTLAARPRKER